MVRLFVTATGTDIGKTFVTAMLANAARRQGRSVRILKPVVSGFDENDFAESDPAILLEAMGRPVTPQNIAEVSPWRFRDPIAAHMAAAKEGREIPFGAIVDTCREAFRGPEELLLIEGIGGVMAPVDNAHTVLDWLVALGIPALLVGGTYVGTISHTLTALGVLRGAGIKVPAVVLSETPDSLVSPEEQATAIGRFVSGVPIRTIRRHAGQTPWASDPCPLLCDLIVGR